MATKSNKIKKQAFLEKMKATLGNITASCEAVDINRCTYYKWINKDPKFKEEIDNLAEMSIDFAESQLKKQIKDGDTTATIFYLKTKGRRRGYSERVEIEGNMNVNLHPLSPEECKAKLKALEEGC